MILVIKYLLIALTLAPLIVDSSTFFPFITGKSLFIRFIITAVWAIFAIGLFSKDFRNKISTRLKKLSKNPIFISMLLFALIFVISALFATPNFNAIAGDIERAEGMVGLLYYISIGILMLVFFEEKDWEYFLKATLVVSAILFLHSLYQYSAGEDRVYSFLGNPIYLADIFLFTMFSSLWLLIKNRGGVVWDKIALAMIPTSIIGVFLTKTRGVMAGFAITAIVLIIYALIKGKGEKFLGRWDLRKISVIFLIVMILFSGLFLSTRSLNFWKNVPGFDRLSEFSLQDKTLQTRLLTFSFGWQATHPGEEGVKKFLIGWGPENFNIAYNKYYDPEFYKYELAWFDRAHNKLMDVLVMNGVLGLGIYFMLWFFVWKESFKKRDNIYESITLIFFSVAYFVQNLFVFDSVATYIFFFAFVALAGHRSISEKREDNDGNDIKLGWKVGVLCMAIWSLISFIWFTALPYKQMKDYMGLTKGEAHSVQEFLDIVDDSTKTFTVAQENIRMHLMNITESQIFSNPSSELNGLVNKTSQLVDELVEKQKYEPRFYLEAAQYYSSLGDAIVVEDKNSAFNFYKKSIDYLNGGFNLISNRPEILYMLGYDYAKIGDIDKMNDVFESAMNLDPKNGDTYYYWGMAKSFLGEGNYNEAYELLEKAFNSDFVHEGKINNQSTINAYNRLSEYFKGNGDYEKVNDFKDRIEEIKEYIKIHKTPEKVTGVSKKYSKNLIIYFIFISMLLLITKFLIKRVD